MINNWASEGVGVGMIKQGGSDKRRRAGRQPTGNFFIKTVNLHDHIYCAQNTVFGTTMGCENTNDFCFTKTLPSYSGERTHHYITTEHWLKMTNQQIQVLFKLVSSRKDKDKTGIWNVSDLRSLLPYLWWKAVVKIKTTAAKTFWRKSIFWC